MFVNAEVLDNVFFQRDGMHKEQAEHAHTPSAQRGGRIFCMYAYMDVRRTSSGIGVKDRGEGEGKVSSEFIKEMWGSLSEKYSKETKQD